MTTDNFKNLDNAQELKRFHLDEIRLILFICASDLSNYADNELVSFSEDIEGRIDVLFESTFLHSITDFINIDNDTIQDFQKLRNTLTNLYSNQWHNKMRDNKTHWFNVRILSLDILQKLRLEYIEPLTFVKNNLDINWT